MSYLIPSLYLLFYALVHSLLATFAVKNTSLRFFGGLRYFRLIYVTISLLLLIPLPFLPWPSGVVYTLSFPYAYFFYAIQTAGAVGFVWTLCHIDFGQFLGWSQRHMPVTDRDEKTILITQGPYRLCRHPLYLFGSITLIANPHMTCAYALLTGWVLLYFYIGSHFEERRMHHLFGEAYQNYCQQTPRFFPHT
jgi:protein-S-isoprenylcysteine O-methyltransferase Ste14